MMTRAERSCEPLSHNQACRVMVASLKLLASLESLSAYVLPPLTVSVIRIVPAIALPPVVVTRETLAVLCHRVNTLAPVDVTGIDKRGCLTTDTVSLVVPMKLAVRHGHDATEAHRATALTLFECRALFPCGSLESLSACLCVHREDTTQGHTRGQVLDMGNSCAYSRVIRREHASGKGLTQSALALSL